jgi:hypothetical protein
MGRPYLVSRLPSLPGTSCEQRSRVGASFSDHAQDGSDLAGQHRQGRSSATTAEPQCSG